jgi:hypothetical protein
MFGFARKEADCAPEPQREGMLTAYTHTPLPTCILQKALPTKDESIRSDRHCAAEAYGQSVCEIWYTFINCKGHRLQANTNQASPYPRI